MVVAVHDVYHLWQTRQCLRFPKHNAEGLAFIAALEAVVEKETKFMYGQDHVVFNLQNLVLEGVAVEEQAVR